MSNMDEVVKSVRELSDAVKSVNEKNQALPEKIMEGIKELVKSAPALTQRSVQFSENMHESEKTEFEIIGSMPKELRQNIDEMVAASKLLGKPVSQLKSWESWKRRAGEFKKPSTPRPEPRAATGFLRTSPANCLIWFSWKRASRRCSELLSCRPTLINCPSGWPESTPTSSRSRPQILAKRRFQWRWFQHWKYHTDRSRSRGPSVDVCRTR